MKRFITETFYRLIENTVSKRMRYLYSTFHVNNRLTGLIGPRGVGKTTLLLQYIKNELFNEGKSFYFSADLVYFQDETLLDFVSELHQIDGYKIIFIDEIHKYQNWNQELKNIYDSFPGLKVVFSGSSMLDLVQGSYDLSRRAKLFRLHGMSFREYLNFSLDRDFEVIPFELLLGGESLTLEKFIGLEKIFSHFEDYLRHGYYPFVFEDLHSYYERITRIIDKTIFEDIANFYSLKTASLPYFKKILTYLAAIQPGELNIHRLAQNLGIDDKTAHHYLTILASVGLIREIFPFEIGGQRIRKPAKLFLNNTNIIHTLKQYLGQTPSKGLERELFFIQSLQDSGNELFYSKLGDFRTRHAIFEIGGKNKTRHQLKKADLPSYLVKDQIVISQKGEIPLLLFGFIY